MGRIPGALRETIGRNIRECRLKKYPGRGGAKRCAEEFGVSPQQWSPWERGFRTPDESRLGEIAAFFGVTVAYLREDHSEPESQPEPPFRVDPLPPERPQGQADLSAPPSVHFRCPFYFPPQPGQPFSGEVRSMCWLAERMFDDLRRFGLPVRFSLEDVDKVLKRYFQYKAAIANSE